MPRRIFRWWTPGSLSITIGHTTFDRVSCDRDADVLYLHVSDPRTAVEFDATPVAK
jgi:hypothetical protein